MSYINKILKEWSYRVDEGMPNPKNEGHLWSLRSMLLEWGWDISAVNQLVYILREGEKNYADNAKNKALGRVGLPWGSKGTPPDGDEPKDDKIGKKKKKKKKKETAAQREKRRAARVEDDLEEINAETDPTKRLQKMGEITKKRRQEIYEGKDMPAGNAGSTLGEQGGGMAAEDIGDPDNPNILEKEWIDREYQSIMDADGEGSLKQKLCEGKNDKECKVVIRGWLKVAYNTGLNELRALKDPKYKAAEEQPDGLPAGQIMDYHGKAMVKNELEKRKEACKFKSGEEKCIAHYDKQLRRVGVPPGNPDELGETDTGIMYMMDNGEIGFKHTSNKKDLNAPHNNKSIGSKKKSMLESAGRQKERGVFPDDDIDEISTAVSAAMDEASKIAERADRQAAADVGGIEDEGALVSGGSSLLKKLPGNSSTKGEDYADKVRKGPKYTELRRELLRMGIEDPKDATEEDILQANINLLKNGSPAPNSVKKQYPEGAEGPVAIGENRDGSKRYWKTVVIDGKEEIRECDAKGNPITTNDSTKLLYKMSEVIKKSRTNAKKAGITEDSSDEELEEFGKFYTPPLTVDEVKWMLFSEETDALEETNEHRKSGMDRAHKEVVDKCKNQDQAWFSKNPEKAKEMGWEKNEDGEWVAKSGAKNGPATQQYVDSYMEDMHWNRYIDGDHDGVGDMSINGQNVAPADFRNCLTKLSGHVKQKDDESDDDYAKRVEAHYEDPANREALKKYLREQTRISAEIEIQEGEKRKGRVSTESQEAHISFDHKNPDTGKPVSVGKETYRSKGVGNNSVMAGLGADMQDCLQKRMDARNK